MSLQAAHVNQAICEKRSTLKAKDNLAVYYGRCLPGLHPVNRLDDYFIAAKCGIVTECNLFEIMDLGQLVQTGSKWLEIRECMWPARSAGLTDDQPSDLAIR